VSRAPRTSRLVLVFDLGCLHGPLGFGNGSVEGLDRLLADAAEMLGEGVVVEGRETNQDRRRSHREPEGEPGPWIRQGQNRRQQGREDGRD
jgi:hypothetical protein